MQPTSCQFHAHAHFHAHTHRHFHLHTHFHAHNHGHNNRHNFNLPNINRHSTQTQNTNNVVATDATNTIIRTRRTSINSNSQESKCVICLDVINRDNSIISITKLRCEHEFHKKCIDRWMIRNTTCPICRRRIRLHRSSRTATRNVIPNSSSSSSSNTRNSSSSSSRTTRGSRYVIRQSNRTSRDNHLSSIASLEERYALRRHRYYRNLSNV